MEPTETPPEPTLTPTPEPVNTSVSLDDVMSYKNEEGLNFFTDDHLEKLKVWGSDDPSKAKFRTKDGNLDVPKLAKSYLELQSRISKLAEPLGENATEAERFEYRKHLQQVLGVPDTPDGYEIIPPKNMPEGVTISDETINAMKIAAHRHNMSREAVQSMFDLHNQVIVHQLQANQKAALKEAKEVETVLKAAWGPEEFSRNDELLQQYLHDFTTSDEDFDNLFNGLQQTRYSGGSRVKEVVYRALCKAAEVVKGEGQNVYVETERRMNERDELRKEFPKSHALLED
jgi:hypothetical protein